MFESKILPGSILSPGLNNSLPVDKTPIFGRLNTGILFNPIEAAIPITEDETISPFVNIFSPDFMSSLLF